MILKDYARSLRKDGSYLLLIKEYENANFSIKEFLEWFSEKIKDEGKYIKLNIFFELCNGS